MKKFTRSACGLPLWINRIPEIGDPATRAIASRPGPGERVALFGYFISFLYEDMRKMGLGSITRAAPLQDPAPGDREDC
jgi:hypothetical protein